MACLTKSSSNGFGDILTCFVSGPDHDFSGAWSESRTDLTSRYPLTHTDTRSKGKRHSLPMTAEEVGSDL
jgi:hypothetical protein